MKTFRTFALLSSLLALSTSFAYADSISLGSFATGTSAASLGFSSSQTAMNFAGYTSTATAPLSPTAPALLNGTANTFALLPNGTWASPSGNSTWIGSAMSSGPGGTDPGYGYYQFSTTFTADGGTYDGTMSVMGDDTVEVLLNGSVIVPFGTLGSDTHCADSGTTCSAVNMIALNGLDLVSGLDANAFTFIVAQAGVLGGNDPSGMDFTASLVSAVAPEPSGLVLLGTGMFAAAALFYRRRPTI